MKKVMFLMYLLSALAIVSAPCFGAATGGYAGQVVVAKSGGNFTDPRTAVNSITDASATKMYLIKVMPGIYDLGTNPLQMKQYVDVEGSGEDNTVITSQVPNLSNNNACNAATVQMISNSKISKLQVKNTFGAPTSGAPYYETIGIVFNGTGGEVEGVKTRVGTDGNVTNANIGICADGSAIATLQNVDVYTVNSRMGIGGIVFNGDTIGIRTFVGSSVVLKDSTVITDAGTVNRGDWSTAIQGSGSFTVTDSYLKSLNGGWAETVYGNLGNTDNVSISHSKIYAINGNSSGAGGDNIAVTGGANLSIINSEIHASSTPLCDNNHALQGGGKIANSLIDAPEGDGLALWYGKLFNNYNVSFDPISNR
jgi:hypothetical protein